MKKHILLFFCLLLAASLLLIGCKDSAKAEEPTSQTAVTEATTEQEDSIYVEEIVAGDDLDLD